MLASPGDAGATKLVRARREDRLALQKKQLELLNRYLDGESPEALERQLEFLEQKQTIRQKLLGAFPGYYGRYISIHFGRFLQSPIETPEQRDAYEQNPHLLGWGGVPSPHPWLPSPARAGGNQAGDRELAAQPQRMEETMADFDAFWEENQKPVLEYLQWEAKRGIPTVCHGGVDGPLPGIWQIQWVLRRLSATDASAQPSL